MTLTALLALAAVCGTAAAAEGHAGLDIKITGLETSEGRVAIAVFDSRESYDARDGARARAFVEIEGLSADWSAELPAGDSYVVLVYHDVNGNGELDTRLFGMPKEPVGIYRYTGRRFGMPDFEDASFVLPDEGLAIEIDLGGDD